MDNRVAYQMVDLLDVSGCSSLAPELTTHEFDYTESGAGTSRKNAKLKKSGCRVSRTVDIGFDDIKNPKITLEGRVVQI